MAIQWATQLTALRNTHLSDSHQLYFGNLSSQTSYMQSLAAFSIPMAPQPGPQGMTVFLPGSWTDLQNIDAVTWVNSDYSNKRFYARIVSKAWKNANRCDAVIEVDPFQTFMFDFQVGEVFVEREMESGEWGASSPSKPRYRNLVPESVETGDYTMNSVQYEDFNDMNIYMFVTTDEHGNSMGGRIMNGVYTALGLVANRTLPLTGQAQYINDKIDDYTDKGRLDAIVAIVMTPARITEMGGQIVNINVPGPTFNTTIDGYAPRNAKMFTHPYYFISVVNGDNEEAQYKFENFNMWGDGNLRTSVVLQMRAIFSLTPTVYLWPQLYGGFSTAGNDSNYSEGISLGEFPQCDWNGDVFANWVGQQNKWFGSPTLTRMATSGLQSAVAGNPVGVVSAGLNVINEYVGRSVIVNESRGNAPTSTKIALGRSRFEIRTVCVKRDQAQRIDDYFTRFGYKTNRVKTPNLRTRPYWNFVKTADCHIKGSFDFEHKTKINTMFDRGLTLWHADRGAIVGNFSRDNRDSGQGGNEPEPPDPPDPPDPVTTFKWPTASTYPITSEFGWRDYPPDPYHTGIDIACPFGTPILATAEGTVTQRVQSSTGYGYYIRLNHGTVNGVKVGSMYAHNSNVSLVNVGDVVQQGQRIAMSGSSGLSTGPHLHFQMEENGTPVNPRKYLP